MNGSTDIRVRFMTPTDLQNVWRLEQMCFSDAWSMKLLSDAMENEYDYFWVAECGGTGACAAGGIAAGSIAGSTGGGAGGCSVSLAGNAAAESAAGLSGTLPAQIPDLRFCGYANLRILAGEGEIERIAVLPALRRRGIGRKLMEAMAVFASDEGVGDMTLEVRAGNTAARKLYESFGFAEEGRRKAYYQNPTEDALILWRRGV